MRLGRYVDPGLVLLGLDTTGVEDTIRTLVGRLAEAGRLEDPERVEAAVLERERGHTTSLGNGVALPHATVPEVDRPTIVVATAPDGIAFGRPGHDQQGADRLFFLLLSPLTEAGAHIKLLARIVRLVRSDSFVDTLLAAESAEQVVEAIEREDALHV